MTPRQAVTELLEDNLPDGIVVVPYARRRCRAHPHHHHAPRRHRHLMTGVRRVLNNAADRALATRHAEAWYVATILATAAASWALLTIARALTATTKETP